MICKQCGALIPEDSRFCTICGAPIALSAEQTGQAETAPEEKKPPEQAAEKEKPELAADSPEPEASGRATEESDPETKAEAPAQEPPQEDDAQPQGSAEKPGEAGLQPPGWNHQTVLYEAAPEEEGEAGGQDASPQEEALQPELVWEQPQEEAQPRSAADSAGTFEAAAAKAEPIYARGLPHGPNQAGGTYAGQGQPYQAGGAPGAQGQAYRPGGAPGAAPQPGQPLGEMTLGEWIRIVVLTAIPIVNIVMLFIWAFSSTDRATKRNWARAQLIVMAVGTAIAVPLTLFLCIMIPAFLIAAGQLFL